MSVNYEMCVYFFKLQATVLLR